mgnify:FL=1
MTKYLVIKIRKHFNGAFSTCIVAEFYNTEEAHERAMYLREKSCALLSYKVIEFTFPKF